MDRKSGMRREGRMPVAARRRPACMDAGGRAVSGTKAEESSGLDHPFPQCGNDNSNDNNRFQLLWNDAKD